MEYGQKSGNIIEFQLLSQEGPPHDPRYGIFLSALREDGNSFFTVLPLRHAAHIPGFVSDLAECSSYPRILGMAHPRHLVPERDPK